MQQTYHTHQLTDASWVQGYGTDTVSAARSDPRDLPTMNELPLHLLPPPALPPTVSNASSSGSESFFEASPVPHREAGGDESADKPQDTMMPTDRKETERANAPRQVRDNQGTQLFTITERSSVTTMKTLPSNGTFQRHIISARQQQLQPYARTPQHDTAVDILTRRQCLSLDEHVLPGTRMVSDA